MVLFYFIYFILLAALTILILFGPLSLLVVLDPDLIDRLVAAPDHQVEDDARVSQNFIDGTAARKLPIVFIMARTFFSRHPGCSFFSACTIPHGPFRGGPLTHHCDLEARYGGRWAPNWRNIYIHAQHTHKHTI